MKKKYLSILIILMLSISLVACGSDDAEVEEPIEEVEVEEEEEIEEEPEIEEEEPVEEPKEEEEIEEEEIEEEQEAEEDGYADMKGEIIGKSDKDINDLKDFNPRDVRNDSTGNWKFDTMSESIKIEEYALSYGEEYIKDGEIHFIVNFTNSTTTRISKNGLMYVTIMEYQDKEEHDANKLAGGMVLEDYLIYPDGDIEDIEE